MGNSEKNKSSIQGTLLMLDDTTPHVAVPVQAIRDGKVIATTLSDEHGDYQFISLKPGAYQVRCQVLGGYVYYRATGDALRVTSYEERISEPTTEEDVGEILHIERGRTLKNIDFRFAPFKKGTWKTYTYLDGLAGNNNVCSIHRDPDGILWFGTDNGVSRYDGKEFINFTTEDGLAGNIIRAIHSDPDGILWFGSGGWQIADDWRVDGSGVSRYDGRGMGDFPHFVNFTTEDGLAGNNISAIHNDPDGILWFGTNSGISRYDGKRFINFTAEDGLVGNNISAIQVDPDGILWFGTNSGVSRYDGKGFVNLTTEDGLADNRVASIYGDPDGTLWFGSGTWMGGGGVSQYDRKGFANFTTADGLVNNKIEVSYSDPDGVMWFGTMGGGVSRCDGGGIGGGPHFVNFTTEDGLVNNAVFHIYCDPDGVMWFGTYAGVSRYDGKEFVNFTQEDALSLESVDTIYRDPDGVMWFGGRGGVSRYDGKEFVTFPTEDGLALGYVISIHDDPDGVLWFITFGRGIFRYDGNAFTNLTTEDGLLSNLVEDTFEAPDGVLWFVTTNGISRYDGKEFANLTTKDGLAFGWVHDIHQSADGTMWFGTLGGGVSGYDGVAWTSLDTRDGLAGDSVFSIEQDSDGLLWFGTENGITRYRRSTVPPKTHIVSVTSDQTYRDLLAIPAFTPGTRVTIDYSSIDFRTLPEKRQYRCQIAEGDASRVTRNGNLDLSWQPPTRETSFDWIPDEAGAYTFAVQAIDRDLNYSEPATLSLTVQPDPKLVSMQMELNDLRQEVRRKYHFSSFIGESAAIRQVHALMERAIDSGLTVLITGETGVGKELVARAIHHNSPRKNKPILARDCGAIPRELLTSELFGHRKGAFTGANEDKMGLFEAASGGTVQLDEIGEMPQDAQVHLLRFLEEREIQRLGENISRHVDVRIIAITNRDLAEEVTAHRFREDLYHRLSEFPIHIPPLREHPEDVPLLAEHFLRDMDKTLDGFASGVIEMLQSYSWPGNVRELRNVIRRAAALAEEGKQIQSYHFPPEITQGESLVQEIISERIGYSRSLDQFRRRLVEEALQECNGNRSQAARLLKMNRPNLVKMIKRLGIDL